MRKIMTLCGVLVGLGVISAANAKITPIEKYQGMGANATSRGGWSCTSLGVSYYDTQPAGFTCNSFATHGRTCYNNCQSDCNATNYPYTSATDCQTAGGVAGISCTYNNVTRYRCSCPTGYVECEEGQGVGQACTADGSDKYASCVAAGVCKEGSVVFSDGKCYENDQAPSGVNPVAVVYDVTNQLAIDITEASKEWMTGGNYDAKLINNPFNNENTSSEFEGAYYVTENGAPSVIAALDFNADTFKTLLNIFNGGIIKDAFAEYTPPGGGNNCNYSSNCGGAVTVGQDENCPSGYNSNGTCKIYNVDCSVRTYRKCSPISNCSSKCSGYNLTATESSSCENGTMSCSCYNNGHSTTKYKCREACVQTGCSVDETTTQTSDTTETNNAKGPLWSRSKTTTTTCTQKTWDCATDSGTCTCVACTKTNQGTAGCSTSNTYGVATCNKFAKDNKTYYCLKGALVKDVSEGTSAATTAASKLGYRDTTQLAALNGKALTLADDKFNFYTPAAKECVSKNNNSGKWFLPTVGDLKNVSQKRAKINETLSKIEGSKSIEGSSYLWSSTQGCGISGENAICNQAYAVNMSSAQEKAFNRGGKQSTRCVLYYGKAW